MKWSLLILASLQLLTANAEFSSYGSLLDDVYNEPQEIKIRSCGYKKYCVSRFLCNVTSNDVDTSGRTLIDIRMNLKVCEYLDKCCHESKILSTVDLPENNSKSPSLPNSNRPESNTNRPPLLNSIKSRPVSHPNQPTNLNSNPFSNSKQPSIPNSMPNQSESNPNQPNSLNSIRPVSNSNQPSVPNRPVGNPSQPSISNSIPSQQASNPSPPTSLNSIRPVSNTNQPSISNFFPNQPARNPNQPDRLNSNQHKGCGYRNKDGYIFKTKHATHNEAEYSEFPWMVAILSRNPNTKLQNECGGSLLTPFIVLTAAHCVYNKEPNTLIVRAGEWDMQTRSEPLPHQEQIVSEIIIHESFDNEALFFDVALLTFNSPLVIEQNVQPICLPTADQIFDSSRCFVTGWGKHKFGKDGRYQYILKKIDMPLVSWIDCQNQLRKTRLSSIFELHDSFICAGGELDHDACTGDGGSPLVCRIPGSNERYFQAGIVAWGIGCGNQDVPGVYTNVKHVLPWLNGKLAMLEANPKHFTATTA